jgi:hypothetical protein
VEYLESAAQGQTDPVIRYHLGMTYLKLGDKRGEATLRAALKSAPDLPEARMAEQLLQIEDRSQKAEVRMPVRGSGPNERH